MLADASGGRPMLDLVGTAIGVLPPGRDPIDGSGVRPGDVIIGLPSSGLHSNGYSLARRVLFSTAGMKLADRVPGTARHLDDALLQPTRVYVAAVQALWAAGVEPRGLVNISGGGLLNLARLNADVSYELDALPPPPPVFGLIAEAGGGSPATMYATFNMGTGFALVVPAARQQAAMAALKSVGAEAAREGRPGGLAEWPAADAHAVPSMCTGMRGLASAEVTLTGPVRDLHSGSFGGGVPNPLHAMAALLAGLHDDAGRVTLPRFYDRVLPLSAQERELFARLPFDAPNERSDLPLPLPGADGSAYPRAE